MTPGSGVGVPATRRTIGTLRLIACCVAIVLGAGALFAFLRAVLQERFFVMLLALLAIAVGANLIFVIVWHRRPDLVDRLRERMHDATPRVGRRHGQVVRLLAAACGAFCAAVAIAGGWFMWQAPDFALFAALWVLPAAYLAVTALYVAISGRSEPDGTAFWLLFWPW